MSKIKVKLSIDPSNRAQMGAFKHLLDIMEGKTPSKTPAKQLTPDDPIKEEAKSEVMSQIDTEVNEAFAEEEAAKAKKAETAAKRKKAREDKKAKEAEAAAKEEESTDLPPEEITLEDVRTMLSSRVQTNRGAIKDKLSEFGAPNVTNLDPKHYRAFYGFMAGLDLPF